MLKPPYQGLDCYIAWLLQCNNIAKAKSYLQQLSKEQIDQQYPELTALLGFLILTGKFELQSSLPLESIFLVHLDIAQMALAAYRHNDRENLDLALQKLPHRSAFRDLRTLLKASIVRI